MDVGAALVADGETAEAAEPGERALDHPAVAAQSLTGLDALAGDAGGMPRCDRRGGSRHVVAFIGMQLLRATPGTTRACPAPGNRIQRRFQPGTSSTLAARRHRQRDPTTVDHHMALAPRFAAIRWVRPGCSPPFWPPASPSPATPATNRVCRRASDAAVPGAAAPRHPPAASHAAAASTSCHCHSPSPAAASPTGCRF